MFAMLRGSAVQLNETRRALRTRRALTAAHPELTAYLHHPSRPRQQVVRQHNQLRGRENVRKV